MKPLQLKIQGLNSFLEEQTIDFEYLTQNGLFGIFGPTGSGKSSIIDAITMALFGAVPRYDGDTTLSQCVNVSTDSIFVSFVFQITNQDGAHVFVCERRFKKKGDALISQMARLYKKTGDDITVIADKVKEVKEAVTQLIGLNYDDFSRSVILPQGKFSKFLLLANKERRKMLERIFNYEKYGENFVKKINKISNDKKNKLELANRSLEIYGDISEKTINKDKQLLITISSELVELKKTIEEKNNELSNLKNVQALNEELRLYNKQKEQLLIKEPYIKQLTQEIQQCKNANLLKPLIDDFKTSEQNANSNQKEIEKQSKIYKDSEKQELEIKILYEKANLLKEEKYPILLDKETKVKEAIILLEDVKQINKERSELQQIYKKNNDIYTNKAKKIETLKKEKIQLTQKLEQISKEKEEILITPELRQGIFQGYELTNKLNEIEKRYINLKNKIAEQKNLIEQNKELLEKYKIQYGAGEGELEKIKIKLKEHNEKKQGDNALLVERKEQLLNNENAIKQKLEKNESLKKLIKLQENEEILLHDKIETQKVLEKDLEKIKNEIIILENEIKNIEQNHKAYYLSSLLEKNEPCPVCGSLEHPAPYIYTEKTSIEDLAGKKEVFLLEEKERNQQVQNLKLEIMTCNKNKENIKSQINELEEMLGDINLEVLQQEFMDEQTQYKYLLETIKKWDMRKDKIEKEFKEKTQTFNDIKINKLTLEQSLEKDNSTLNSLNFDLSNMETEKNKFESSLMDLQKEFQILDFSKEYEKAKQSDNLINKLEKAEKSSRLLLSKVTEETEEENKLLIIMEREQDKILVEGKAKRETEDLYNKKIKLLTEDNEPTAYIIKIQQEISEILKAEELSREKLVKTGDIKQQALIKLKNYLDRKETLINILEKDKLKLQQGLNDYNFPSIEKAVNYFASVEMLTMYENETKEFQDKLNTILVNQNALMEKLKNIDTSNIEEKLLKLISILETLNESIKTKTEESAVLKEKIETNTKLLIEINKLLKEKTKLTESVDLLSDLSSLFQGNKFAEFLSIRQLRYVAIEASKRLKLMTLGRYAIELDGSEFIIRDDHNGGTRRSPKTLSGGETFMASLCLSLALSSKIQLANGAPLEFFFLDEGFGTLDPDLTDVVMGALENLRNEKLCVGLITHVEELKSRINERLIVIPPVHGISGTKIKAF